MLNSISGKINGFQIEGLHGDLVRPPLTPPTPASIAFGPSPLPRSFEGNAGVDAQLGNIKRADVESRGDSADH